MTDENKIKRESFIFYRSFFEALTGMDKKSQADCLMAIADYALNGTEPTMTPEVRMFFTLVKPQLDANNKRYENGTKGGRPKNQTETKTKPNNNQNETKPKPNDNDNVNDNEKENTIKEKSNVDTVDNFLKQATKSVSGKNIKNKVLVSNQFSISNVPDLKCYVDEMPEDVIDSVEKWLINTKSGQMVDISFISKQFFNFAKRMGRPVFKDQDKRMY